MRTNRTFEMIETNGVRLRCVVEGDGPLAIMVHGWPESWYSWRHQIAPVRAAGYRVVVPDVRGYGGGRARPSLETYVTERIIGLVPRLTHHFREPTSLICTHLRAATLRNPP